MNRSVKVRVLLTTATVLLLGAPVAQASGLPKLLNSGGPATKHDFQVRPSTILYGMPQEALAGRHHSNGNYSPLDWTSWTTKDGHGSGFSWLNNCKPSCASGKYHSYPVKLKAWRAKTQSGLKIFTRLTITYTGKRPSYIKHKTQVWKVTKHGRSWYWSMPTG
jgi:hypothetical protein